MSHRTESGTRFAFRKDAYMQDQLELKVGRKTDWAGWLAQVISFYTRVEATALTGMKKHGAPAEEVAQGKAMAEALMAAYQDKNPTPEMHSQLLRNGMKCSRPWIVG